MSLKFISSIVLVAASLTTAYSFAQSETAPVAGASTTAASGTILGFAPGITFIAVSGIIVAAASQDVKVISGTGTGATGTITGSSGTR